MLYILIAQCTLNKKLYKNSLIIPTILEEKYTWIYNVCISVYQTIYFVFTLFILVQGLYLLNLKWKWNQNKMKPVKELFHFYIYPTLWSWTKIKSKLCNNKNNIFSNNEYV